MKKQLYRQKGRSIGLKAGNAVTNKLITVGGSVGYTIGIIADAKDAALFGAVLMWKVLRAERTVQEV